MLHPLVKTLKQPIAITMWDFSWLERRWPGAGYEDWEQMLDELKERGYDAIRIDAYPHLVHADADKEWLLLPTSNQQNWGAPANIKVSPWPALAAGLRPVPATFVASRFPDSRDETWPKIKMKKMCCY